MVASSCACEGSFCPAEKRRSAMVMPPTAMLLPADRPVSIGAKLQSAADARMAPIGLSTAPEGTPGFAACGGAGAASREARSGQVQQGADGVAPAPRHPQLGAVAQQHGGVARRQRLQPPDAA